MNKKRFPGRNRAKRIDEQKAQEGWHNFKLY